MDGAKSRCPSHAASVRWIPTGLYGSGPLAPASSGGGEQVGVSEAVTEEDTSHYSLADFRKHGQSILKSGPDQSRLRI